MASRRRLEGLQKALEHQVRMLPQVIPELELAEVLLKMLPTDVNMSAANTTLQHRPEAVESVGVRDAVDVLPLAMLHNQVRVAFGGKRHIRAIFVRGDGRAFGDIRHDMRNERVALRVRNDLGNNVAAALDHAEHGGLFDLPAVFAPLAMLPRLAADVGFVGLDRARQAIVAVNLRHVLADFVAHPPRRFVGDGKLALQFLGRHAMPRRGEQVHGVKPLGQGRMRLVEGRPDHRVNVMTTPRTGIGWHFPDAGEAPFLATLRALKGFAVAKFHQIVKAAIVIRKPPEEILNAGHRFSPILMGRL